MTTVIEVEGMSCSGCEEIVAGALEEVAGVESASADRERGVAEVEGEPDVQALVDAADYAGYTGSAAAGAGADTDSDADDGDEVTGAADADAVEDAADAGDADGVADADEAGDAEETADAEE